MDIILKGFLTGCVLSIMIGPVFFVLLETSIRRGIKAALAFDMGVLLNDILYIAVAYLFYNQVADLKDGDNNFIVRLIGGSLFVLYGIYYFFKPVNQEAHANLVDVTTSKSDYLLLTLKGFLLNLANPLVVFYWFGVMTLGSEMSSEANQEYGLIMFLITILVTFFSVDFLKILGAKKLQPLVTRKRLIMLNRLIGIIFAVSGMTLIVQGLIGVLK